MIQKNFGLFMQPDDNLLLGVYLLFLQHMKIVHLKEFPTISKDKEEKN